MSENYGAPRICVHTPLVTANRVTTINKISSFLNSKVFLLVEMQIKKKSYRPNSILYNKITNSIAV